MKIWSARSVVKYVAMGLTVVAFALMPRLVSADLLSWTSHMPVVESSTDGNINSDWRDMCATKFHSTKYAAQIAGMSESPYPKSDCAMSEVGNFTLLYGVHSGLSIQFAGDLKAYLIRGVDCESQQCLYMPSRDSLVVLESNNFIRTGRVAIYKNFVSKLTLVPDLIPENRYFTFNQEEPDALISDFFVPEEEGYNGYIKSMQKSQNDKWLMVEYDDGGLFRVDMDNMQMVKFADRMSIYSGIEYDITDNGQHIAIFGDYTQNAIYDITSDCGETIPITASEIEIKKRLQNPCPSVYVGNVGTNQADPNDVLIPNMKAAYMPQFSDDGGEISYYATSSSDSSLLKRVTLRAANYTSPPQLDYLALGDSYSSGEGDNDPYGINYYREFTDVAGDASKGIPTERCHVSTRSYPYILALKMGLGIDGSKQWDTVACSGAKMYDINDDNAKGYLGQTGRLKGYNADALKTQALNEFIPGRQEQIEFVKKYKPKVITLTIGGNDVDFSNKIFACVASITTCNYVNTQRPDIAGQIKNQYGNLVKLYNDLYISSDKKAKIYVLGYPQFINGNNDAVCNRHSFLLNTAEREMIQNSVTYLNNVIKEATRAAGVKYIDIEDSLTGHRLCDDGEKYVEGANFRVGTAGVTDYGSFHPNAKGHGAMAEHVWNVADQRSLVDYGWCNNFGEIICPDSSAGKKNIVVPPYYQDVAWQNSFYKQMTKFNQFINGTVDIIVGAYTFGANIAVSIVGHSDPVDLGKYTTASDGSLKATFRLPSSMEVGFHTIEITGTSYTGEPIKYEQTIFVMGQNPDDIDADGIVDNNDPVVGMGVEGQFVSTSSESDKLQNQKTKYTTDSRMRQRSVDRVEQVDAKLLTMAFVLFGVIAIIKIYNKLMIK